MWGGRALAWGVLTVRSSEPGSRIDGRKPVTAATSAAGGEGSAAGGAGAVIRRTRPFPSGAGSCKMPMMRVLVALTLAALVGHADARTATGYQGGQKSTVKIVEVAGAEVEVRTAMAFKAMAKAARRAGVELAIRSGFRTHAKQTRLYRQYRRGEGNLAARPGYSQHENGRALDLVITREKTYSWLIAHANQFGFHRTVHGEPWHWEYLGGGDQTTVERGVWSAPAVARPDDRGEHPCTRDWGYARPPVAQPAEPAEPTEPTESAESPGPSVAGEPG